MDQIQITLAEVTHTAVQIRSYNDQLHEKLMLLKQHMDHLEKGWQSPAANTIKEKFNGMLPIFTNYHDINQTYAKFLDVTVQAYEQTETAINQQAASFM